jgi:hypothetical protein
LGDRERGGAQCREVGHQADRIRTVHLAYLLVIKAVFRNGISNNVSACDVSTNKAGPIINETARRLGTAGSLAVRALHADNTTLVTY